MTLEYSREPKSEFDNQEIAEKEILAEIQRLLTELSEDELRSVLREGELDDAGVKSELIERIMES